MIWIGFFKNVILKPSQQYQFNELMRSTVLRRTKKTKIGGKKIVHLPKKTITLLEIELNEYERFLYNKIEAESQNQAQDTTKSNVNLDFKVFTRVFLVAYTCTSITYAITSSL